MNTIATTASTSTMLAIDLGKYKSVACVHDQGTGEIRFTTFDTTRVELQRMIAREEHGVVTHMPALWPRYRNVRRSALPSSKARRATLSSWVPRHW